MKKKSYYATVSKSDGESLISQYYKQLAFKVSILKYILAAFTIGFGLFCFTQYRSEITIENFRYMLKFFDFSTEAVQTGGQIPLSLDRQFVAAGLRNNLAVGDKAGLSIFDYSGKRLLHSSFHSEHIALATSSKYVYAYDLGGNSLRIFNTYSQIYSLSTDYPILGLTNNEEGAFGIITAASDYKSAIIVYNKEFQQTFSRYFGENFITSIAINRYGNRVATAINSVVNGDYMFELLEFDTEREEPLNRLKFIGEMPLKLRYDYEGNLVVLTNKSLRFYDKNFEQKSQIFFEEKLPSNYFFYDNYAIMSYVIGSVKGGSEINVYKNDGTLARTAQLDEGIRDIVAGEDKIYVLSYTKLHIIDIVQGQSGDSSTFVGTDPSKLVYSGDFIILISPDGATINRIRTTSESAVEQVLE